MPVDAMFILATASFALGLSLATYRWFAVHNGWPMGEWQAHRPGLPIALGLFCVLLSMLFATFRGGATALILPLLGVLCALTWTSLMRVGSQSSLLLAPAALVSLLVLWYSAASHIQVNFEPDRSRPGMLGHSGTSGSNLPYPADSDRTDRVPSYPTSPPSPR